jgi:hypothetical protein
VPNTPPHLLFGEDSAHLLEELFDRPVAFHRIFVKVTGSVNAALMLSQAIYWSKRTKKEAAKWFYKSQAEWEEETGLTRYEQEHARKLLRSSGVWDEQLKGVPATLWYHIDLERLQDRLLEYHQPVCGKTPNWIAGNQQTSLGQTPIHLSLSETTTETTAENTQDERTRYSLKTFEQFWQAYPKKLDREEAKIRWLALSSLDQTAAVEALPPWVASKEWADTQFIPAPVTFIRKRRWESKPAQEKPKEENAYEKARRLERKLGLR